MKPMSHKLATMGAGCFWCTEAVFQEVEGILDVVSGYSGGNVPGYPTYREICSGRTGHAEVIQLSYDPEIISYRDIVAVFMTTHDPTTLNRQGADVGTQYRSVIFYHDEEQKKDAEAVIAELADAYDDPIVTEISPLDTFYKAEPEHQNFYRSHPRQPYCTYVINPKLAKLRKVHSGLLKNKVS
ncbi:MAG: peptide-methionine (S)-S-oxide reductase MsrA [Flavobacteriaceae bacterium]|nr:peptide-methionine (S)-S-oxide reductase MsrA [Flavobacteriaceae bacterium]